MARTGKYLANGGFEADVVQENKRGGRVRQEFTVQGMTAVNAFDGTAGWKIDPFAGKKDAESLSEEELHGIRVDADFDDPLVDYKAKGSTAEFAGKDQFEGSDVYKVKITLKGGDTRTYFLDADAWVPIRIEETRYVRGTAQEYETTLGDYKPVAGWYLPFSMETGMKGQDKAKVTLTRVETNIPLDDARFTRPPLAAPAPKSDLVPPKPIPDEEN